MAEEQRIHSNVFKKPPEVVLDKRFKVHNNLPLMSIGQMEVMLKVSNVDLVKDENLNESKEYTLEITKAEVIEVESNV